jgi:hypothetical protein
MYFVGRAIRVFDILPEHRQSLFRQKMYYTNRGGSGMQVNYKRYSLYLLRRQASTPILAGVDSSGFDSSAGLSHCGEPDRGTDLLLGRPIYLYIAIACRAMGGQGQHCLRGQREDCTRVLSGAFRGT